MRPAAATNEVLVADKLVGFGGQGKVYSAWRRRGGGGSAAGWDRVAVKCIGKVFHSTERAWRTLNELRLLRLLRHPNIIGMQRALVAPPACHDSFNEVHIVMDLMDGDLSSALYRRDGVNGVMDIQWCMFQILRGLAFMHASGVLHRDLKPSNILLSGSGGNVVKIGDLGYACSILGQQGQQLGYTATPWYRAPELCGAYYSGLHPFAIDMWSAGCILAEMVLRTGPPFSGENNDHVFVLICKALRKPSEQFIKCVGNNDTSTFMRALPHEQWASSPFLQQVRYATAAEPELEDLLLSLLAFDPAARPTAAQALAHPYFRTLSQPAAERDGLDAIDTTEQRPLLDGGNTGNQGTDGKHETMEAAAVRELLCREISCSMVDPRTHPKPRVCHGPREGHGIKWNH